MMTKDRDTGLKMTRTSGGTAASGTAGAGATAAASSGGTGTNRSSTTAGSGAAGSSASAGASAGAGTSKGKGNGNGNGNGGGTSSSGAGTEIRLRPIATTTATAAASASAASAASGQQTNNKKSQKSQQSSTGGAAAAARNNTTTGASSTGSSTAAAATGVAPTATGDHASRNGHQEDMEAVVVGNNGVPPRPQKPCCLCWCCCCSCSCLALRGNQEGKDKHKDQESDLNCDAESMPSLEEIRSWGDSFEKLMRNSGGRKVFREFLKCEYSEENILFWLACEDLKKESKPELVEEKARLIYEDYISILSPKEVSLDSRVREVVNQNMMDPSPHTFDEAQVQIFTLMHRDSYPRFVNSVMYKKLAQLNTQHRGSSVSSAVSNPASRKESLAT